MAGFLILFFISFSHAQSVTKTYRGQSPHQAGVCELTLKTSAAGVQGFSLRGPGELWTNFGACVNGCKSEMNEMFLDETLFAKYKFNEVRQEAYPQITLSSRFERDAPSLIFISRSLEIDLSNGEADEFRYSSNIEIGVVPVDVETINCLHLKPAEGNSTP